MAKVKRRSLLVENVRGRTWDEMTAEARRVASMPDGVCTTGWPLVRLKDNGRFTDLWAAHITVTEPERGC